MRIYVVGWPHSGNKHVGRLLDGAMGWGPSRFSLPLSRGGDAPDEKCPTVCLTHCAAWHEPRDRLIEESTLAYRSLRDDERLVWLVRDPRDAAVSAWQAGLHSGGYAPGYTLLQYLDEHFTTAGNPSGPFCSWGTHVGGWLEAVERDESIAYTIHEALVADRQGELRRVLRALGLETDDKHIRAIAKQEARYTRPAYDGSGRQVKRGRHGEWRAHFGAREARLLEDHCGDLIARLGYDDVRWKQLLERTQSA